MVVDLFSLIGIFYILSFLKDQLGSDRFEDLQGILRKSAPECICLVIFLLCLVGLPPLPGFIGKFTLLGAAVRHQKLALAAVGIGSMVISTAAVARLFFHLVGDFQKSSDLPVAGSLSRQVFLSLVMIPIVLVGVFADFVFNWAGQSLGFIFW